MSHAEELGYFQAVADANAPLLSDASVLEIGSYDVNGTVRGIFNRAHRYVGVDLLGGPGVDVVCYGHEFAEPDGAFDVAISGECFEHDQHWAETFANMVRMTRPGGLVAFTCASRGRFEHGTRRTGSDSSPGTQARGLDYYRNLSARDFGTLPLADWFTSYRFWYLPSHCDLYFAGVRAGDPPGSQQRAQLPDAERVESLSSLTPLARRLALVPLRPLVRVLPDDRFQSMVWPARSLVRRLGRTR